MGLDRTFEAMPIKEMPHTDITTSYVALGTVLSEPVFILFLFNGTDATIYVSEDGSNDHYRLGPGDSRSIDLQANKADQRIGSKPTGLQFYARGILGALPTTGIAWIEGQTL